MDSKRRARAAFAFEEAAMTIEIHSGISTPCIGVCELRADGYCEGCLRSGDEIARWIAMGETERMRLMCEVLPQREATVK
jgi:predicted Fe-S protein YdhL (DUF1289 family)